METRAPLSCCRRLRAGGDPRGVRLRLLAQQHRRHRARATNYQVVLQWSGAGPAGGRRRAVQRHPRGRGDLRSGSCRTIRASSMPPSRLPRATPVRADTKVGLDFQGLTGVPRGDAGGRHASSPSRGEPRPLIAEGRRRAKHDAGRRAMRCGKVDTVLEDNSGPLHDAIANFGTFSGRACAQHPQPRRHSWPVSTDDGRRRRRRRRRWCFDLARRRISGQRGQTLSGIAFHRRADRDRAAADPALAVLAGGDNPGFADFALGRQPCRNWCRRD